MRARGHDNAGVATTASSRPPPDRGPARGVARHAARAVLRPRLRARADAVHGADGGPTRRGTASAQAMLVLGVMWWSWVGYAWLTSVVDPEEGSVRISMFAAMAAFLVVALCVPGAFDDEALLFACAYGSSATRRSGCCWSPAATTPGCATRSRARDQHDDRRRAARRRLVPRRRAAGRAVGARARARHGRAAVHRLVAAGGSSPAHFAERHGLIVIIALGESIVAIGVGAEAGVDAGVVVAAVLGIVVAGALWWLYFDVVALVAERRLSQRAAGQGAERDRARLVLLPALPDGRRDRAARARAQEDARARRRAAEARARPPRCSAAPRSTCSRTSPSAGATCTASATRG